VFFSPDDSSLQLAQVEAEAERLAEDPREFSAAVCEQLGRVLLAMFNEHAHPARMFHMVSQVADSENPDVTLLLPLAWAAAEGSGVLFDPEGGIN
jgi:hypothetical protein